MKKVLFLGYVVSPEEANKASGASVAGNKMQWNIVHHLSQKADVTVHCMTIMPLACFPRDKTILQRAEERELCEGVISNRIRYINLPIIKQMSQIISMYQAAEKAIIEQQINQIVCFNLFPQVGIPVRWLKRRFPQIPVACILADLPIDDNTKRKGISVWLRKIFEKQTWSSFSVCDKFVVLNKRAAELYLHDKPYIVVDGGVDETDIACASKNKVPAEQKNILFCGALTEYNGILNLLEAFKRTPDLELFLDIYGSGYLEEEVRKAAEIDSRIHFYGRVDNRTIMQKQREAWVLINPRIVDNLIAQVTFPSKTFEYMLSGTPIISTRLSGYTKEYDDLMIYTGDSVDELMETIRLVESMSQDELSAYAQRAMSFVISQKTWKHQVEKISRFLEE